MESVKIIRALSELKEELSEVNSQGTEMPKIRLYFQADKDKVRAHNYFNHAHCLDVATIHLWHGKAEVQIICKTDMAFIINYFLNQNVGISKLAQKLNELVDEFGYYKY